MKDKVKCPKCGCKETTRTAFAEDGRVVEEKIVCKNCGRIKLFWSYGMEEFKDWEDMTRPPLFRRIKDYFFWRRTNKLIKKRKLKDKEIELPF
jgi:hypothetical protein